MDTYLSLKKWISSFLYNQTLLFGIPRKWKEVDPKMTNLLSYNLQDF